MTQDKGLRLFVVGACAAVAVLFGSSRASAEISVGVPYPIVSDIIDADVGLCNVGGENRVCVVWHDELPYGEEEPATCQVTAVPNSLYFGKLNQVLRIEGDDQDNYVRFRSYAFSICGVWLRPLEFNSTGSLEVYGKGGSDMITINNETAVPLKVLLDGGAGNDWFELQGGGIGGYVNAKIVGGTGSDRLHADRYIKDGATLLFSSVNLGSGADIVYLGRHYAEFVSALNCGDGVDYVGGWYSATSGSSSFVNCETVK